MSPAPQSSIDGYASESSLAPGEPLHLHVAAPGARYRIEIDRLGYYGGAGGRRVACIPGCAGDKAPVSQPAPGTPDPSTGFLDAGWSVTDAFTIPTDWVTGMYVAELILTTGPDAGKSTDVSFVLRPPAGSTPSQVLVMIPVNTHVAYNAWGGKSLYGFNSTGGVPANHVSFNRPLLQNPSPSYNELGAWYTEYPLIRYLESQGYDVSYVADTDVDAAPASLRSHRLVMSAGHGEYWTKNMRDAFDAARDAGVNLAFMGANTGYWQIRYEDNRRTIVAYKENAANDPTTDPSQLTTRFALLNPPRDECALEGVHFADDDHGDEGNRPYSVAAGALTDRWMAGTGFVAGDTLPWLVGYEFDHIHVGCLSPAPTSLFHWQDTVSSADATRYTAASGARVFASGSMQFVWGLGGHGWGGFAPHGAQVAPDPRLVRFMNNGLADLTRPAPPISVQAAVDDPNQVLVTVSRHADAQAGTVRVYRHNGAGDFAPGDPGAKVACETTGTQCEAKGVPGHSQQRFLAVTVDRWGESQPVLASAAVSLPDSPPAVSLSGNPTPTALDPDSFTATGQDPDGDSVSYTWTIDGVVQPGATGPSLTRAFAAPGHHDIGVTGDDGFGATNSDSLSVEVADRPPSVGVAASPGSPLTRDPVTFTASAQDLDGGTLSYHWSVDGVDQPGATGTTLTRSFDQPGRHTATVTVADGQGASVSSSRTVDWGNRAPSVRINGPRSFSTLRSEHFDARGSFDPEGTALSYQWRLDRRGLGNAVGLDVRLTSPGTHRLELVARDAQGTTSTTAIDLHAGDRPPLVVAVGPRRAPAGRLAMFAARALDPDGRVDGIAWSFPGARGSMTGTQVQRRLPGRVRGLVRVAPRPGHAGALWLPVRTLPGTSGRAVTVVGVLSPGSGAAQITIDRWHCRRRHCAYARVRRTTARTAHDGRFSLRYTADRAGTYRFTVTAPPPSGDPRFTLAVSTRIGLLDRP